jgi:hypothetical protein
MMKSRLWMRVVELLFGYSVSYLTPDEVRFTRKSEQPKGDN